MKRLLFAVLLLCTCIACNDQKPVPVGDNMKEVHEALKRKFSPDLFITKHWINKQVFMEITFTAFEKERAAEADSLSGAIHQFIVDEYPSLIAELQHLKIRYMPPQTENSDVNNEMVSHTYLIKDEKLR